MRRRKWMKCVIPALAACATMWACSPAPQDPAEVEPGAPAGYEFSSDWFSEHIPVWEEVLDEFRGQPNLQYLEIGTFEGRSFFWVLDNILTHPTSRATGIDTFPVGLRQRFDHNLAASGHHDRVTTIADTSQLALRTLPLDTYDIIYVDGSHAAKDVLADAVLCWPLLKNGGLLILDDYDWQPEWPLEFRPQVAVDAFLTVFRNDLEVVRRSNQVIVRKLEMSMPYVLRLGDHAYLWRHHELYRRGEPAPIPLSADEREALERLAVSRGFGQVGYSVSTEQTSDEMVEALLARLEIELDSAG